MEDIRIMSFIEEYARITPDAPAIMDADRQVVNYSRLNETVIAMTEFLISHGIMNNQRIAAIIENGLDMAVAYLAVSNTASFVPLGSDLSEEQYRYYFEILKVDTLLIPDNKNILLRRIAEEMRINIIYIKKVIEHEAIFYELSGGEEREKTVPVKLAKNDEIAVISYTSGTTAKPKIVPRSHINEYHYALQSVKFLSLTGIDRVLIITPMFRGVSLNMLLASLASGGCAVIVNNLTPDHIFRVIKETAITWFFASPSLFQTLVEHGENKRIRITDQIRFLNSGGAPLPEKLEIRIKDVFHAPVFDAYGLTEAGWIGYTAFAPKGLKKGSLGAPTYVEIAIMDENGNQYEKNITGEICVRGPQVIKGYDNGKKINEESFFGDWFRTGDCGYLDDDGYLFITGRIKEIINRGGEKVSPYEIEAAISLHPDVLDTAVFPIPGIGGNEDVGAAVVMREGSSLYLKDLRRFLSGKVVAFKMPTRLYVLPEIPISDAGKVQRQNIFQEIIARGINQQPEYAANEEIVKPRNNTEIALDKIFKKILPITKFSITDTFFELGGDSLRAAVLYEQIQKAFRLQIPLKYIFKNGSIEKLAEYIENHNKNAALRPFLVPFQEEGTKNPIFFVHGAKGEAVVYRHLANNFDPDRPFYAISFNPEGADWQHPITFEQIAGHYIKDIHSIRPKGPYILAGQCVGGVIAYEMAVQLHKSGQEIGLLAMYDSIIQWPGESVDVKDKLLNKIDEVKTKGIKAVLNYFALKFSYYQSRLLTVIYGKSPYLFKPYIFNLMNKNTLINYALSGYKIKQYDGEIIFFKPENNTRNISQATIDILAKLARAIRIVPIRGSHSSVFYEENAENTREVLENILTDIS